jgi:hypothetical protein
VPKVPDFPTYILSLCIVGLLFNTSFLFVMIKILENTALPALRKSLSNKIKLLERKRQCYQAPKGALIRHSSTGANDESLRCEVHFTPTAVRKGEFSSGRHCPN